MLQCCTCYSICTEKAFCSFTILHGRPYCMCCCVVLIHLLLLCLLFHQHDVDLRTAFSMLLGSTNFDVIWFISELNKTYVSDNKQCKTKEDEEETVEKHRKEGYNKNEVIVGHTYCVQIQYYFILYFCLLSVI